MKKPKPDVPPKKRLKDRKIPAKVMAQAIAIAKKLDDGIHFAELQGRRMYQTGVVSFQLRQWYRLVAVPCDEGYCAIEVLSHENYNKSSYVKA